MAIKNEICEECDTLTVDGSDPVFGNDGIKFKPHECAPEMLTEWEAMGLYDDMLDECCEPYTLNGMEYMPSTILKECDPIAYRVGFADYADSLAQEGMPVEGYI